MNKVLTNSYQDNSDEEKSIGRSNLDAAKLIQVSTPSRSYSGDLTMNQTYGGTSRLEVSVDNNAVGVIPPLPTEANTVLVNDENNIVKWSTIKGGGTDERWNHPATYNYQSNTVYLNSIPLGSYDMNTSTDVMGVITFYSTATNSYSIIPWNEGSLSFNTNFATQCTNIPYSLSGLITLPFHFHTSNPSTTPLPDRIGIKGGSGATGTDITILHAITQTR